MTNLLQVVPYYLLSPSDIWERDVDNLIESPWSLNGGIYSVLQVGGSYHYHVVSWLETVHLSQQLVQRIAHMSLLLAVPLRCCRVYLIYEDYAWG